MTGPTPGTPAGRWPTDQLALAMCASDPHGCRGTTAAGRPCPWHRNLAENPAAFVTAREAAARDEGRAEGARLAVRLNDEVARLRQQVEDLIDLSDNLRIEVAAAEQRGAEQLREAAHRTVHHFDQLDEDDRAALWMQIVHGGDTSLSTDWDEAYATVRAAAGAEGGAL